MKFSQMAALALTTAGFAAGADNEWIARASFARSLNEDKSPAELADGFDSTEAVHLSLEFKSRPPKPIISARFYFRDELINEARVDLEKLNPPVAPDAAIFVAFTLKPKEPFPVSDQYRVETSAEDIPLGTYRFHINPPADAAPSRVKRILLTQEVPAEIADVADQSEFAPDDSAILMGAAEIGKSSWLQAEWYREGKRDDALTQTLTYDANRPDAVFQFKNRPEGGWKPGRHEAVLLLNGSEAARKSFTVQGPATAPEAPVAPTLKRATLHRDNGKGRAGDPVEFFSPEDRVLHFVCDLENVVSGLTGEITWSLVDADGGLKDIVMARAPLTARTANRLAGRFKAARALPVGRYRVEIACQKKTLASREFEVR